MKKSEQKTGNSAFFSEADADDAFSDHRFRAKNAATT